jgi:hypothetical protein
MAKRGGNISNNGDTLYGNEADDEYRLPHNTLTVINYRYVKIRHQTLGELLKIGITEYSTGDSLHKTLFILVKVNLTYFKSVTGDYNIAHFL